MLLRSGKTLKEMARPTNCVTSTTLQSQSSSQAHSTQASAPIVGAGVSTVVGATIIMPISKEMWVTAPTTTPTTVVVVTQPEMRPLCLHLLLVYMCLPAFLSLLKLGLFLMTGS